MNIRHTVINPLLRSVPLACIAIALITATQFAGAQQRSSWKTSHLERAKATSVSADEALAAAQRAADNIGKWKQSENILSRRRELRAIKGLSMDQIIAYDALSDQHDDLMVHWSENTGLPIFMTGSALYASPLYLRNEFEQASLEFSAYKFLDVYKDLLRIESPRNEFSVRTITRSEETGNIQVRMTQSFKGIEVWGKEIVVQFNEQGQVNLFAGRYAATPACKAEFDIDEIQAAAIAVAHLGANTTIENFDAKTQSMLDYRGPVTNRIIFSENGKSIPAYMVEVRPDIVSRWRYFIDAGSGAVLRAYDASCTDGPAKAQATDLLGQTRTIDTYLYQGAYYMIDASRPMFDATRSVFPHTPVGALLTLDANNTDLQTLTHIMSQDNTWSNPSAVSAFYNASTTYEYFRTVHNRNSIDNNGATIISVVNVTKGGQTMPNAYWNGRFISYGNGGLGFQPFARSLDLGAHEMTHGVTENTANLEYLSQSGALNESFSDIFAVMVDRDDWRIGEDITPTNSDFPSGAARDMSDPHNQSSQDKPSWQPNHMNEYVSLPEDQDNGGVHVNSGIPNHAAYLLSQAIGREKTERIMYNALATKLTRQSQFIDFRLAIIQAAKEIFGQTEADACAQACNQVGILDGSGSGGPDDQNPVSGADEMLFISNDPADMYYLWTVAAPATSPNDFRSLSATPPYSKPSIADDGSIALFIDAEYDLRALSLNPQTPNEQIIANDGIWNTVALSRDGKRIALTTTILAPTIYLINLENTPPTVVPFPVATPNYSEEGVPNTAAFVDAMDFSADNEHIIYDCLNKISINGFDYEFWDINLIHIWDKTKDDYGTGKTFRIFAQEPRYNLSFPSFSKNSPYIFAFDMEDTWTNRRYVFATNMHTHETSAVYELDPRDYGYPSYSGDDKVLSFSSLPPDGPLANTYVIFNLPMAENKISAAGTAAEYIYPCSVPVWYRRGTRPVDVEHISIPESGYSLSQNYPNPFNPGTSIDFDVPERSNVTITIYDRMGRTVRRLANGVFDSGAHTLLWDGTNDNGAVQPSGMYFYRLNAGNVSLTRSMILAK